MGTLLDLSFVVLLAQESQSIFGFCGVIGQIYAQSLDFNVVFSG
jgi:hypothetical protein